jgi:MFS family permease
VFATLRCSNLARLAAAGLVSSLGDWLLLIALPFYVYGRTGSPLDTGASVIAGTLPRLVLGPLIGGLVDRGDRRQTLLACDLVRAAALGLLLLATFNLPSYLAVLGLNLAVGIMGMSQVIAQRTLLQQRVPDRGRGRAFATFGTVQSLALLGGLMLGSLVGAGAGLSPLLDLAAGLYLLSGLVALGLRPLAPSGHDRYTRN